MNRLQKQAIKALSLEWGTIEQVAAENDVYLILEREHEIDVEMDVEASAYLLKATTAEAMVYLMARYKDAFFESEYDARAEELRKTIVDFLQWNDPNGAYHDDCPENEGCPMSLAQAAEALSVVASDAEGWA